ncbi:MAG: sulfite exporter TauE/SafE family protein [Planctomycetota bacterium]|nr:MAG: sulfite exporter TauE/SafE family protein [Planctomycetota bacterium]
MLRTAVLFGVFFTVSIVFSLLGQGGGALFTPIQVFAGIDFHEAATTSLFLIVTVSFSSALVFRKGGKVDLPLVAVLETVTALGGFAGGLSSARVGSATLSYGFAAFIVFAAVFMVGPFHPDRVAPCTRSGPLYWRRRTGDQEYCVHLGVALPASFVAGLPSGLLGVGGGLLKVPLMVLLLGIPMDVAVGSSAVMVGVTALGGLAGHVANGHWNWRLSLALAVAVFFGAQIGARYSLSLSKKKLKRTFGYFLIALAGLMVAKTLGWLPAGPAHAPH